MLKNLLFIIICDREIQHEMLQNNLIIFFIQPILVGLLCDEFGLLR